MITSTVLFPFERLGGTLAAVTLGLFLIQLFYWLMVYTRPLKASRRKAPPNKAAANSDSMPPVSVIICAGNELENLRQHLPSILAQSYPTYEVIVVNDSFSDEMENLLKTLELQHPNLYHTYIPDNSKYLSRKKLALMVGIKAAKHDILLFTEADCAPVSDRWIASMTGGYTPDTEIVLGFCAYRYSDGFLNQLIAYDNLLTGLRYLLAALTGYPFTGNGNNLSYRRELFFRQKGFSKSMVLNSGADDLFVNQSATGKNTCAVLIPSGITETLPMTFRAWREKQISRICTQRRYRGGKLTFFRIEESSYFLFLVAVLASVVVGLSAMEHWSLAVFAGSLYLVRYITKAVVLHLSARALRQKPATLLLFLLEFIRPFFILYVHIYRLIRKRNDYIFQLK